MLMVRRIAIVLVLALLGVGATRAEDAKAGVLKKGARVAVVGDSITEQKIYSRNIEMYLMACLSHLDLHVIQLGWSGERASGFANRMANDLLPWKPDVVTTCYGMNDGSYTAYTDAIGTAYRTPMVDVVARLKAAGATVVVGSPGAVDTKYFNRPNLTHDVYNANLAKLRDIAKEIADKEGMPFANVHDAMIKAMQAAKAKLGDDYDVCGRDGFHPGPNGQFAMAYAFLKGMGLDGNLATFTVDLKGNATATDGHKVLSAAGGKVEIESTRYPFCFRGDAKSSGDPYSITPFLPFNAELNRFMLIVKNIETPNAKVTWGKDSKTFSKAELEAGVNLAEHFINNPFQDAFFKLDALALNKENYETFMIKQAITQHPQLLNILDKDKAAEEAIANLRKLLEAKYEKLHETVKAGVTPVKHMLVIEPAN